MEPHKCPRCDAVLMPGVDLPDKVRLCPRHGLVWREGEPLPWCRGEYGFLGTGFLGGYRRERPTQARVEGFAEPFGVSGECVVPLRVCVTTPRGDVFEVAPWELHRDLDAARDTFDPVPSPEDVERFPE